MLLNKQVDAVTFTSSSTVTHFVEMLNRSDLPDLLEDVAVASIGPVTSRTASELGLTVHVEASQYTVDGLVNALARHFGSEKADEIPHHGT